MQGTHNASGLKNNPLKIEDGTIRLELNAHQIDFEICDFDEFTSYPAFEGGTFTDENGIEIDLKRYINNLALDPVATHKIKTASSEASPEKKHSDRVVTFTSIIECRLDGNIAQFDT